MEAHNRDISPTGAIKGIFEPIAPLIANPKINRAFATFEARAVAAKKSYHLLGRLGLILVLISAFYTIAESLVLPRFPEGIALSALAITAGILGLGLQAFLILSHRKHRWLVARFGAERVRSIAFQAFPLAQYASDTSELEISANEFYVTALAQLDAELNAGVAAIDLYNEKTALKLPDIETTQTSADLGTLARTAYIELRLRYQQRFASGQALKLKDAKRIDESFADFLYLMGGILAVMALSVKLAFPAARTLSAWIDFAAIASFITGLAKIVFDAANDSGPSRERYELYLTELKSIDKAAADDQLDLITLVRRTEQAALWELGQFCASASRISYRL
jgi:hypothetical protein